MRSETSSKTAATLTKPLTKTVLKPALDTAVQSALDDLMVAQKQDGHWVFELEADATIPAEYVLLEHFTDRIDSERQKKIGHYLRRIQCDHGGWPLYEGGEFNLSASVKAYFALKALGDTPDMPHMKKAKEAILAHGGAERSNVFTRIQLALFGEVPWSAVPVMPIELMLLPSKAFFSIWNMSYWSRTVIAPLLVLGYLRPIAKNPKKVNVQELFCRDPATIKDWIKGPYRSVWGYVFKGLDTVMRPIIPLLPESLKKKACDKAVEFIEPRLSDGGLGAIYPAMANVVMMYRALGVDDNAPLPKQAWQSIQDLLVEKEGEVYCQPCVSPVWDTGLAGLAVEEAMDANPEQADKLKKELTKSADWLVERQILDLKGDWAVNAPDLAPGGWAFQYENDYYPDVDDTAVIGMFLHRLDGKKYDNAIERARIWINGMQSTNGGWGAFDIDNDLEALNHIPFADHGALLDPPTADVSARCISFLAQLGHEEDKPIIDRGIEYLRREQEDDGSWFGRWGTNYIYGTWSVLSALNAAGIDSQDPMVRRAVDWLLKVRHEDGGWGEDCATYEGAEPGTYHRSLPTQTAWALLALIAAGEVDHEAVSAGISWLELNQKPDGQWDEPAYNAVGFPKVFYLKYHGYRKFFPLLALSRFKNMRKSGLKRPVYGV